MNFVLFRGICSSVPLSWQPAPQQHVSTAQTVAHNTKSFASKRDQRRQIGGLFAAVVVVRSKAVKTSLSSNIFWWIVQGSKPKEINGRLSWRPRRKQAANAANRPIVPAVAMAVSTPSMAASPPYDGNMKLFSFADFRPRNRRMC